MAVQRETVDKVARRVSAAVNGEASVLLACDWVSDRYRELCSRGFFKHLRKVGSFVVPASVDDGTVSISRGSKQVTGDATAQAAWSPSLVGRYFRADNTWYRIDSYANDTLFLEKDYAETDVSSGSYDIVARFVELPDDVRWIGTIVWLRDGRTLTESSIEELDNLEPRRILVSDSGPSVFAEAPESDDGHKQIEVYPYVKTNDELFGIAYWAIPAFLDPEDLIPKQVESWLMREGALIDAYRFMKTKALTSNPPVEQAAAVWRNEERAQVTKWERDVVQATKADEAISDKEMILARFGGGWGGGRDVVSAYDEVVARGARP